MGRNLNVVLIFARTTLTASTSWDPADCRRTSTGTTRRHDAARHGTPLFRQETCRGFASPRSHSFAARRHRMVLCSVSALLQIICKLIMAENKERTFLMVKPDGVQRGLVGKIIQRFEEKGFKLVAMRMVWPTEELLKKHYADLASRPFFPGLVKYMSSGPVVPMVWEGLNVVKTGRVMLGETNPKDSAPGTIRGDFCIQVGRNIIHGSDSVESAKKEISLWFGEKEVIDWTHASENWIYE